MNFICFISNFIICRETQAPNFSSYELMFYELIKSLVYSSKQRGITDQRRNSDRLYTSLTPNY